MLVSLSVVLVPVSPAKPTVGVARVLSSVKARGVELLPTLPAASVWRTMTDLAPSPVKVKLLPLPVTQVPPPLVLYCQLAPLSRPVTLTVPTLVMASVADKPVSVARSKVGAMGGAVSGGVDGALSLDTLLPAARARPATPTNIAPGMLIAATAAPAPAAAVVAPAPAAVPAAVADTSAAAAACGTAAAGTTA